MIQDSLHDLKGNIRVFCRVRPLLSSEDGPVAISYPTTTEALGQRIEVLQHVHGPGQKHEFVFDRVFTPQSSQEEVFEEISQLVQSALDGYKVCIFAYGQTGSGKTHTMMGTPGDRGLINRSIEQILEAKKTLREDGWKYDFRVSMSEICNETIRDLLSSNPSVADLTIHDVWTSEQVLSFLEQAGKKRSVGETWMNKHSSRSHFIFTLHISGINETIDKRVEGVLNLIDLAGSESAFRSGAAGVRLKETGAINKSLLALTSVIAALATESSHVPYRESKLTLHLKGYFGGESKTLMLVNVSPAPTLVHESLCSLRFATRVNACEIRRQRSI